MFPLYTVPVEVARQQGDESVRGCDCFLATLCLFLLTQGKAAFLWGLSSKAEISCLCFSAYSIRSNGMAQFSKATPSREHNLCI